MKKAVIKTGFCVAYDWELLKHSIPRIYDQSDLICLAIDKDRHSWSCKPFEFDELAFHQFVQEIDTENKIIIYEDDFSREDLNARENCNLHRSLIAEKMGEGGWHVQIDSDEYVLDYKAFTDQLEAINASPSGNEKALNVCINLIPIFKKLKNGYLVVDFGGSEPELVPFATNKPQYLYARRNDHFNLITTHFAVHETWSRSEKELIFKLSNWGHSAEELRKESERNRYLDLWRSVNESNYLDFKNIHPANPTAWPGLKYIEASDMTELIEKLGDPSFPLSKFQLRIRNSRNIARIKQLF